MPPEAARSSSTCRAERLALTVRTGRARLVAGVEERQRTHALGGGAQDLQRHPPAHRVRHEHEARRRLREHRLRHGGQRVEFPVLGDEAAHAPAQGVKLSGPDRAIAQEAGQQQRWRRLRGDSPAAARHSR